jgi:hypothetical protein
MNKDNDTPKKSPSENMGGKAISTDSIISIVFDQLNIKGLLKLIFSKTSIKVTDQFIDAFLLLAFLLIVFYNSGSLKLQWSLATIALASIFMMALGDLIASNTPFFKRFFSRDIKTKMFLENIPSMAKREIKSGMKFQVFSSNCMNFFLKSIEKDKDKFPPYFISLVIDTQVLRKKNLDLLFSPAILKNILPNVIIDVCFRNKDSLTQEHVKNIYDMYKNNEKIIKILIATQSNSYYLIQKFPETSELSNYYNKYQSNKKHLDWTLKIIPISKFRAIQKLLIMSLFLFFIVIISFLFEYSGTQVQIHEMVWVVFIGSVFMIVLVNSFVIEPVFIKIEKFYYGRFINNLLK